MQSLFPTGGMARNAPPAPIIQFKAGKCVMTQQPDGKYLVSADTRRGRIAMIRTDGLLHFRWENRSNNEIEDDRIIFPGDAVFKRVKTGRENDRVYMLSFQSGQKFMYWMQDVNAAKDQEYLVQVNEIISNTPAAPAANPAAAANPPALGLDLSSLLGAFNVAAPSSSAPLTAAHLQQALAGAAPQAPPQPTPAPGLEEIMTSEAIITSGILNDPAVRAEAIQHLPEGQQSDAFLEENIRSPQFQQALGALSEALVQDGATVAGSFGIDPAPGNAELIRGDAVGGFLTSIQAATQSDDSTTQPSQPQNNEEAKDSSNDSAMEE